MRWIGVLIFIFSILPFVGCASLFSSNPDALRIEDVDRPISEIRAIAARLLPVGQRAISPNGHEILSKHFKMDGTKYVPAADAAERFYAHIVILGDRRPYDIEVFVVHEKRAARENDYTYARVGVDPKLTSDLEQSLRQELTKRREERNIIDDFRVY
ncbi:MAG: hypothetical protein AB7G93_01930 [Bdellovibrionales bacterium]